jgi:hypothetical protein
MLTSKSFFLPPNNPNIFYLLIPKFKQKKAP